MIQDQSGVCHLLLGRNLNKVVASGGGHGLDF